MMEKIKCIKLIDEYEKNKREKDLKKLHNISQSKIHMELNEYKREIMKKSNNEIYDKACQISTMNDFVAMLNIDILHAKEDIKLLKYILTEDNVVFGFYDYSLNYDGYDLEVIYEEVTNLALENYEYEKEKINITEKWEIEEKEDFVWLCATDKAVIKDLEYHTDYWKTSNIDKNLCDFLGATDLDNIENEIEDVKNSIFEKIKTMLKELKLMLVKISDINEPLEQLLILDEQQNKVGNILYDGTVTYESKEMEDKYSSNLNEIKQMLSMSRMLEQRIDKEISEKGYMDLDEYCKIITKGINVYTEKYWTEEDIEVFCEYDYYEDAISEVENKIRAFTDDYLNLNYKKIEEQGETEELYDYEIYFYDKKYEFSNIKEIKETFDKKAITPSI